MQTFNTLLASQAPAIAALPPVQDSFIAFSPPQTIGIWYLKSSTYHKSVPSTQLPHLSAYLTNPSFHLNNHSLPPILLPSYDQHHTRESAILTAIQQAYTGYSPPQSFTLCWHLSVGLYGLHPTLPHTLPPAPNLSFAAIAHAAYLWGSVQNHTAWDQVRNSHLHQINRCLQHNSDLSATLQRTYRGYFIRVRSRKFGAMLSIRPHPVQPQQWISHDSAPIDEYRSCALFLDSQATLHQIRDSLRQAGIDLIG